MKNTSGQFDEVISKCKEIYEKKMQDYGAAWRVLRPASLTDQIYIKAQRIRNVQLLGEQRISDSITGEFMGIVNYAAMAVIQLQLGQVDKIDGDITCLLEKYDEVIAEAKKLMTDKNHDYGEAWRNMRVSSIDDIILMKLLRIKQIEDHKGKTIISEGVEANYYDIINYAIFALIIIDEKENN